METELKGPDTTQKIDASEKKYNNPNKPVFRTKLEIIVDIQALSQSEAEEISNKCMKLALEEWQFFKHFTSKPEVSLGTSVCYKMGVLSNGN